MKFRSVVRALIVGGALASTSAYSSGAAGPIPHTELTRSRPAAGAVVAEPVREILLTFSTRVQLPLSRVELTGPEGASVPSASLGHPEDRPDQLRLPLAETLAPGSYRVDWRAGAPDGHIVAGDFAFTVQDPDAPPDTTPTFAPPPPAVEPAQATPLVPPGTGTRWLHLLGTILLLGAVGFRYGVIRPLSADATMRDVTAEAETGAVRLAWAGALLLLTTIPLRLLVQMEALGAPEGGVVARAGGLLFRTAWGAGWFVHLVAVALALIGLVLLRGEGPGTRGWRTLAGAAVLLPLVPALSGHAWGTEARVLAAPVLYVHVACAGVWLGGLIALVLAGLSAVRRAGDRSAPAADAKLPPLARLVNAFSRVALIAVGTLVASGVVSAVIQLGGPGDLVGTAWGRTLLVKVAVAGGAFLLGFYNWRKVRPSLAVRPDPGELRIPASLEAALGVIVILVTAVLVATPSP